MRSKGGAGSKGARVAQWWERLPPINVVRVQIPVSTPLCGLSLLLVLSLAPRGFSPGTPVFPSPQKPTFPNSNSTRHQVDEEPLCGCATCKSLLIYFIYFIYMRNATFELGLRSRATYMYYINSNMWKLCRSYFISMITPWDFLLKDDIMFIFSNKFVSLISSDRSWKHSSCPSMHLWL